ncbi:MAG: NAD(P)-dependent alcohol dehydrogenase [Spirochaetales bacterium]|nr:NAD(P)-dependent alcohol dehydrogenase [Spirochaetales bacterium]
MEKGISYSRWGGPEELSFRSLPLRASIVPDREVLKKGEILVQVRAVSINPIDWKILSGSQRPFTLSRFPRIFGTDFSGTVYRAGKEARRNGFREGMAVMGLVSPLNKGSGRQWLKVRADHCLILPENNSFEDGAALPEACISALLATSFSRRKKPGKVLLFGASGGVGSIALQILASRGWDVTAVCRDEQRMVLKELGCRRFLDRHSWKEDISGKGEWDAVVDCPAAVIRDNPAALLKKGGVYAPVYIPDSFIPFQVLRTLFWFFSPYKTGMLLGYPSAKRMKEIGMLLGSGAVKALIDSVHPAAEIHKAVEKSRKGGVLGKIIVTL